ncbi:MAG: transcriptional regulator, partial [Anaerolineae bacterium]
MDWDGLIVHTKLVPARLRKHILPRPRLEQRLLEALDYRVTVIRAGTGYGKSTALAAYSGSGAQTIWYRLFEEDADPPVFLMYLVHACAHALGDISAVGYLNHWGEAPGMLPWQPAIDALVNDLGQQENGPILLILDDVHIVNSSETARAMLTRLLMRAPANLHVVL